MNSRQERRRWGGSPNLARNIILRVHSIYFCASGVATHTIIGMVAAFTVFLHWDYAATLCMPQIW
jgi:hypothetical protein